MSDAANLGEARRRTESAEQAEERQRRTCDCAKTCLEVTPPNWASPAAHQPAEQAEERQRRTCDCAKTCLEVTPPNGRSPVAWRRDVDGFVGEVPGHDGGEELAQAGRQGGLVAGQELVERPPAGVVERRGLERFEPLGVPGPGLVGPGDVDALVGVEVVHREVELDVLGPDARTDLDVAEAALLVELTPGGVGAGLAAVDTAAGDLPPGALVGAHGVAALDEEDPTLTVEQHDTRAAGRRMVQTTQALSSSGGRGRGCPWRRRAPWRAPVPVRR